MVDSSDSRSDILVTSPQDIPEDLPTVPEEEPALQEIDYSACQRLADCLEDYLAKDIDDEFNDIVLKELHRIEELMNHFDRSKLLNQARGFYEFRANPMTLLAQERFFRFLREKFERELRENENADITERLLYELRYPFIARSKMSALAILEENSEDLENGALNLRVSAIDGIVSSSFIAMERLLKYVISFYGRWLGDQFDATEGNPLGLLESYIPKNDRYSITRWYTDKKGWEPSYNQVLKVIRPLNELCFDSEYESQFRETFIDEDDGIRAYDYFGSEQQLKDLEDLVTLRNAYSHDLREQKPGEQPFSRTRRQRQSEARETLRILLPYARYLAREVIPPVVIVQDYLLSSAGVIRLRCLHENKRVQSYYLRDQVEFYFVEPCFLYARGVKDWSDEPVELEDPIVLMPVDFRYERPPEQR